MLTESLVESLAVSMLHMDKQCANFYTKDLSLNATTSSVCMGFKSSCLMFSGQTLGFYTPVERRDVLWNRPVRPSVRPSTIACERDILKTACRIDFTFWYGLNTTKTSDAIDLGHSTNTKMAATAVYCLWTRYLENRLSDWLHILISPYFQVVNLIPCKLHLSGV